MNVSLTPELERLVGEKVKSGMYQTASEVVREALRVLQHRDEELRRLRSDIQAGLDRSSAADLLSMTERRVVSLQPR